jgi:N-methylhydantoinase A
MKEQRLPIGKIKLTRYVHLLFKGQVHTVRVPVTDFDLKAPDRGQGIVWRFVELYELRYGEGTAYTQAGVEAVALSVEAMAELPKPKLSEAKLGNPNASKAIKGKRRVYLHERNAFVEIPIYAGDRLHPGHRFKGPAVVEGEDNTVLVRTGHEMWIDRYQNMRIDLQVSARKSAKVTKMTKAKSAKVMAAKAKSTKAKSPAKPKSNARKKVRRKGSR